MIKRQKMLITGQVQSVGFRPAVHAIATSLGLSGTVRNDTKGKTVEAQTDEAIAETANLLLAGKIVAIKGIGGFHLAVDALNKRAVARLRPKGRMDARSVRSIFRV